MEEKLKLALETGKAVIVIKNDEEIFKLMVADSTEELIKQFVEEQEQGDFLEYKTSDEAFLCARNQVLFNHITNFSDSIIMLKEPALTQTEEFVNYQNFFNKSIEEVTKDINKNSYPNGFYDWDMLIVEFNNTNIIHKLQNTVFELYVSK